MQSKIHLGAFRAVIACTLALFAVTGITKSAVGQDPAEYMTFDIGGWRFAPVVSPLEQTALAFLAHYVGSDAYAGNIRVVLFEQFSAGVWDGRTWPSGDLGLAAAYVIFTMPEGDSILGDPVIANAASQFEAPCDTPDNWNPELFGLGLSKNDPLYDIVSVMDEPGEILDNLRQTGYPITPELPAITAVVAAKAAGDLSAYRQAMILATGSTAPQQEPESVSLAAATLEADVTGTNVLLTSLSSQVEITLFNSDPVVAGWWPFCGCTTTWGPCITTPPEFPCGSTPSIGSILCKYCEAGTKSYTYTGKTFWTCSPCTGGGSVSCQIIVATCTVLCPATCPPTSAGCP